MTDPATRTVGESSGISIQGVTKEFAAGRGQRDLTRALDDVNLEVKDGEFLVLLGPSGCGKSTLLRCIAGLERPASGSITIGDTTVFDSETGVNLSPDRRPMSMIFQSYALWPHMTAARNVAYPLECQKVDKATISKSVHEMLSRVGIGDLAARLPAEMSGGQQQRLALARALISGAKVVVFDEPLSNVDAVVREKLRLELIRMQRALGFTAIYVTHDQDEAMHLADRIAVMVSGRIHQLGEPTEMYSSPRDVNVARFLGSSNEVTFVVAEQSNGYVSGESGIGQIRCRWNPVELGSPPRPGDSMSAFGRPPDFHLSLLDGEVAGSGAQHNRWVGQIETSRFLGTHIEYVVKVEGGRIRSWRPAVGEGRPLIEGDRVAVEVADRQLLAVPMSDVHNPVSG